MQHMIIPHVLALRYIQCLMANIASWHIVLVIQIIFSKLAIFSSEIDRIRCVDRYCTLPWNNTLKKIMVNLWNKCHGIKWLEMQQYGIKKRSCQKIMRYRRTLRHLSQFYDCDSKTLSHCDIRHTKYFLMLRVNKLPWYTKICTVL